MTNYKRDFGSFHVSNVQELISADEKDYAPPAFPIPLSDFTEYANSHFEFGASARKKHFYLENDCTFLNHGAFGACLKQGVETVQAWQRYIETQPLRFLDREMLPHMVYITRRMVTLVGCEAKNIILISNVTTGINSIMRSLPLQEGDIVYHLSLEYGANKKILSVICEEKGAKLHEQFIPLSLENEQQLLDAVSSSLPESGCKLAVFDHIPSNTPFILPVKKLAKLCHQRGIQVLIDGAHALGQITLDIPSLDVDFYVANCHKWFCGPKGSALMYIAPKHHDTVHPLVISHGYQSGFNSQFIWTACHLLQEWQGQLLAPSTMTGSMLCVSLPAAMYKDIEQLSYSHAECVQNALFYQYNIEVPIKCVQGHLYVRLSAHIYNTIEEYQLLAKAMLELNEQKVLCDL